MLALATVTFAGAGFALRDDPRWFLASGMCGSLWWGWDLLVQFVFEPIEHFVEHLLGGGVAAGSTADTRPSLDDTIRLLESHLANPTARKIDINSAVRLEEIYRTAKKDAARASEVIRKVRDRYPDSPELKYYDEEGRWSPPGDG